MTPIHTLTGPAGECTVPRELRLELQPEQRTDKPLWPHDEAMELIHALEQAGAAVVQGELLCVGDDGEVSRLPWERWRRGIPDPIYQPWGKRWRCARNDHEAWSAWVARAAAYARTMAHELTGDARATPAGKVHLDLAWVMEDELALFDEPGWERRQRSRVIEHGGGARAWMFRQVWRMHRVGPTAPGSYYGHIAGDLTDIPDDARFANVSARGSNRERLAELTSLEILSTGACTQSAMRDMGRLSRLRVLYVNGIDLASLEPLAGLSALEFAYVAGGSRLRSAGPLGELPALRYLYLLADGMRDLSGLAAFTQVNSLHVGAAPAVDSLAPLGGLANLRYLSIFCERVRDGSVAPLGRLRGLKELGAVPSRLSLEERAWLSAALPQTEGPHRTPLLPGDTYGSEERCARCGGRDMHLAAGTRRRRLCATCDAGAIRRHVARWEALLAAATAASRGGPSAGE